MEQIHFDIPADRRQSRPGMATDAYRQLLEATVQHLESLREQGVRSVTVQPETLKALRPPVGSAPPRGPAERSASGFPPPSQVASKPAAVAPPIPTATRRLDLGSPLPPDAKKAALEELHARALDCIRCPHLAASRNHVVFGVGDLHAQILFVGEAPGADEDAEGEPFVGRAGELLTRILQAMGLTRDTVYIANVLKCRPDTPGQQVGNRKPTTEEMHTCLPYLEEQIRIIRPKVMVALGGTAIEGLIGRSVQVTRIRGQWLQFHDIPLMPTYHPAYLLRNEAISEKRKVWEDMLAVMERIGLPISEKQRRFFTKPA